MPDYKKGQIYKIVNNENTNVYYGSTVEPLYKRMYKHRNKHNTCMSKNIGVDLYQCKIILVENYPCNSKYELESRERYFIENFECVNKRIPTRTEKEYRQDNKKLLAQKTQKWYEKNKNKKKIYDKKYREKNKDKTKKYKKEYYEKNKDKDKVECVCGCIVSKSNLSQHKKTKKHCKLIESSSSSSKLSI